MACLSLVTTVLNVYLSKGQVHPLLIPYQEVPVNSEHPTNKRSGSSTFGFSGYLYNDLSHQIKANQSREWFPVMTAKNHKCRGKEVSLVGETWKSKDLLVKKSTVIYIRFCGHFVRKGLRKLIAGLSCCNSYSICRKDALNAKITGSFFITFTPQQP